MATLYTLAQIFEEARIDSDFAQYEDLDLYPTTKGSIDPISPLDGNNWDPNSCIRDLLEKVETMTNVINPNPILLLIELEVHFLRIALEERMDDENSIKH